jgi:hypothetical protein
MTNDKAQIVNGAGEIGLDWVRALRVFFLQMLPGKSWNGEAGLQGVARESEAAVGNRAEFDPLLVRFRATLGCWFARVIGFRTGIMPGLGRFRFGWA